MNSGDIAELKEALKVACDQDSLPDGVERLIDLINNITPTQLKIIEN